MNWQKVSVSLMPLILFLAISSLVTACNADSKDLAATEVVNKVIDPTETSPASLEDDPSDDSLEEISPISGSTPTKQPTLETQPPPEESDAGETTSIGQTLLEERCTECHSLTRVKNKSRSLEKWRATVEEMVRKGAELSITDQEILIEHLAESYP